MAFLWTALVLYLIILPKVLGVRPNNYTCCVFDVLLILLWLCLYLYFIIVLDFSWRYRCNNFLEIMTNRNIFFFKNGCSFVLYFVTVVIDTLTLAFFICNVFHKNLPDNKYSVDNDGFLLKYLPYTSSLLVDCNFTKLNQTKKNQ